MMGEFAEKDSKLLTQYFNTREREMKKVVFLVLIATSSWIHAEPSNTVAYLMSEPVTLFDQGLRGLGESINNSLRIEEFPELIDGKFNAGGKYDWDANKIIIWGTAYQKASTLESTIPTQLCERIIERLKQNRGYGEINFVKYGIGMAGGFRHLGMV